MLRQVRIGCVALLASSACFALTACASRRWYEGTIVHPAELPVRAFAPVTFVHPADGDSTEVATELASRVQASGTPAAVATRDAVEPRANGVLVGIEVHFTTRAETRWSTRPENVCGPYGCYLRQVSYPFDIVTLVAEATVAVRQSPDAQPVAERVAHVEDQGPDSMSRRALLRRRLVAEIGAWFDPRSESVRTQIPWVDDSDYARALDLADEHRWDDAVEALDAIRRSSQFAARPNVERAKVLVALAIAIRFSTGAHERPVGTLETALARAEEASALDPEGGHESLRNSIRSQLDEARVLAVQRGDVNAVAGTITVPDAYR